MVFQQDSLDANSSWIPSNEQDASRSSKWIALLGQRDQPTDGVEDYCKHLGQALAKCGLSLRLVRVPWAECGWLGAIRRVWKESAGWKGSWVLMQYTALSWSRRGFPLGAVAVLCVLNLRGARCAVVFHEFKRQVVPERWIDRVRGVCQDVVIRRLYHEAAKALFTVPVEIVTWLPVDDCKASFIPIGANIPERLNPRLPAPPEREKTVIIFGVTGGQNMGAEIETIIAIMRDARRSLSGLRLVVLGRGSSDAEKLLAPALRENSVEVVAKGILPAEKIACELESADAFLFVRGAITTQRGSAIASIACGLPIVGYQDGEINHPLNEAGVEWAPLGDAEALARGLVRVLSDRRRWMELHCRNLRVQQKYLSWSRIAQKYLTLLSE
jgi:glycosyltransferase involved in cell wall biosynthesis